MRNCVLVVAVCAVATTHELHSACFFAEYKFDNLYMKHYLLL